ncbi:ATP-binding protein [Actinophytocola sp. NPDC049390]|uniref:ATP-binding protein n=1 Tax=Actinophytocola sp. NPDC049390 TaxID=3363894 RepID=UPI0037B7C08B
MTSPVADGQAVLVVPHRVDASASLVRLWVAAAIDGVPVTSRLAVTLVVDELVSNARTHGGSPCVLRLSLDDTRRFLFVYVDDATARDTASWSAGAGLTLVDALTVTWGVHRRAGGKAVWAVLPLGVRLDGLANPPQPPPGAWTAT